MNHLSLPQFSLLAVFLLPAWALGALSGLGITAGAHRLWSHRSYKAKLPLRIFLMICQSIAGQNSLYVWCRDHRAHHKFCETDADPHNTKRGFFFAYVTVHFLLSLSLFLLHLTFRLHASCISMMPPPLLLSPVHSLMRLPLFFLFSTDFYSSTSFFVSRSHVGWLMHKKHPAVISAAKKLNFNDLLDDPVVRFQSDHYNLLYLLFALLIPCGIPVIFWGERPLVSFFFCYISRYVTSLHCTWFVNSTAHMFGNRPYDETIEPRENVFVSYGALGEGYHNYHHTYPSDYRTAEDGKLLNLTKLFIDTMARFHLASELKVAPLAAAAWNYEKRPHHVTKVTKLSPHTEQRSHA